MLSIIMECNKRKSIVRSTIAAEALSLQEGSRGYHFSTGSNAGNKRLGGEMVSIDAHVDNKNIVEAIHSTKAVDDKRLRIDISAMKEPVVNVEVRCVKLCPGSVQLSNCMTKRAAQRYQLMRVIQSGCMELDGWSLYYSHNTDIRYLDLYIIILKTRTVEVHWDI